MYTIVIIRSDGLTKGKFGLRIDKGSPCVLWCSHIHFIICLSF